MNQRNLFYIIQLAVVLAFSACFSNIKAQNGKFTLVIDAGHGGHDPGAIGKISREKDINLSVAQNLGELIASNYNDVKVVYTRTTDKYLTLQERANIVNNNHADLFISIHTNSAPSQSAFGTESFTLGLAKTKGNLDVAMRENAVMLLEDDYKSKYKGFDPRSDDSYIMFEFMQDKYLDRSISIASDIQNQFKSHAGRSDRGVRQAGFWVLYQSACPSVLVELGFISNPAEEKYLASNSGQKELAEAIYKAFKKFKYELDKKSGKIVQTKSYNETEVVKTEEVGRNDKRSELADAPVQSKITTSKDAMLSAKEKAKLQAKADSIKKVEEQNKASKAETTDVVSSALAKNESAKDTKSKSKKNEQAELEKGKVDAKVEPQVKAVVEKPKSEVKVEPSNAKPTSETISVASTSKTANSTKSTTLSPELEKHVDMNAYAAMAEQPVYKLQLFASPRKLNSNAADFRGIRNTDFFVENGLYKYTIGSDLNYEVISKLRKEMLQLFPEAFVVAFLGKKKIGIAEALKLTNKKK